MLLLCAFPFEPALAQSSLPAGVTLSPVNPRTEQDDDFARHRTFDWQGIDVQLIRFSEGGYAWEVYLLTRPTAEAPVNWVILHDNEDAAFDSGLAALKTYGGVMLAVSTTRQTATYAARTLNGGKGAARGLPCQKQAGWPLCDPNRNFGPATPKFTRVLSAYIEPGSPVLAFHTNARHPEGTVSMMAADGRPKPGSRPRPPVNTGNMDWDSFIYLPVPRASVAPPFETACGTRLAAAGVNIQYEAVTPGANDGSLSNWLTLERPALRFYNLEAPSGSPAEASARHAMMLKAVLKLCEG